MAPECRGRWLAVSSLADKSETGKSGADKFRPDKFRSGRVGAGRVDLDSTVIGCAAAAGWLPGLVDDDTEVHPGVIAHVSTCLRCQAELARYRRLLRLLHQLRGEVLDPPPTSVNEVLAAIAAEGGHRDLRSVLLSRTAAYVGSAFVATAAASAGIFVRANRRAG